MINFLHHGMYPDLTFDGVKESYGFPYRYDPRSKEISKNVTSVVKEIARRFKEEPLMHTRWFLWGKPIAFWSWNTVQGIGDVFIYPVSKSPYFSEKHFQWPHFLMYIAHRPLVVLCILGCLMAWFPVSTIGLPEKAIFASRFASLLVIYFTIMHMVGFPLPRYSVPLRPFVYGMALFTAYLINSHISRHRKGELSKVRQESG